MKVMKTKLKHFAVPAIYAIALLVFGTSMYLVQKVVNRQTFEINEDMEYEETDLIRSFVSDQYLLIKNSMIITNHKNLKRML